jgi:hypothetical protein
VGLRLIQPAHDAETDADFTLLHEGRNDCMEWTLVSGERVGQARRELEQSASRRYLG